MDSTNRGIPDGTENEQQDQQPTSSSSTNNENALASQQQQQQQPGPGPGPAQPRQPLKMVWEPNRAYMANLIGMGISSVAAKKALFFTKNTSTEAAIEWIFENQTPDLETPLELELERNPRLAAGMGVIGLRAGGRPEIEEDDDGNDDDDEEEDGENDGGNLGDDLYKMVFIVNAELSMGVGKIAAQVAHAALGLHRILLQHQIKYGESLLAWTEYGETKIVLRGESTEHLINLESQAVNSGLPCYLVHDAGRTQVQAGSTTVLSIFGSKRRVDRVTGTLKLY